MGESTTAEWRTLDPSSPWWRSGSIYQIYPHSFADGNGDGLGDLPGILSRVDYLSWLGVDAVWLSPIYCSPQHDNGYDVSDYRNIDPRFGTLQDLDKLIEALNKRNIRLIMDLVVNHTSSEHEWFLKSASSRDSDFRDWYIWRDPRPGTVGGQPGSEPTNWGSYFSEAAWTWHPPTEQYYLHLYASSQPDLNWENPSVRDAVYDMMDFWLDRGVGGFRMDVINLISKPKLFEDGSHQWPSGLADPSEFVRFGPRLTEYLREMHERVFAKRSPEIVRVGETPGLTVEQARELTRSRECGLDMVFQFEHMELDREKGDRLKPTLPSIPLLRENLARWQEGLFEDGWNSLYLNNHDQPRMVSRFGNPAPDQWAASAKAIALAVYALQGTPSLFQGEEIGMIGATLDSAKDFRDIRSINYLKAARRLGLNETKVLDDLRKTARDNARTPVQWAAGPDAGFGSYDTWMPIADHLPEATVEFQLGDEESILHFYKNLLKFRKSHQIIANGETKVLETGDLPIIAYLRESSHESMIVIANIASVRQPVPSNVLQILSKAAPPILQNMDRSEPNWLEPWEAFAALVLSN